MENGLTPGARKLRQASRSKLLDGLELRIPATQVTAVRTGEAYWELPGQMNAHDTEMPVLTRGTGPRPDSHP